MFEKNDMVQGRRKVLKSGGGVGQSNVGIICPLSLAEHRGMVGICPKHLLAATVLNPISTRVGQIMPTIEGCPYQLLNYSAGLFCGGKTY